MNLQSLLTALLLLPMAISYPRLFPGPCGIPVVISAFQLLPPLLCSPCSRSPMTHRKIKSFLAMIRCSQASNQIFPTHLQALCNSLSLCLAALISSRVSLHSLSFCCYWLSLFLEHSKCFCVLRTLYTLFLLLGTFFSQICRYLV